MKMIVIADESWGIGADGDLLVQLPEDMKFFRETTKGNVIILGRKTLQSFPMSKPLPNRVNIVITRDKNFSAEGTIVVNSIEDAVKLYNEKYSHLEGFVAGGGTIYRQMLKYCDTALVTKMKMKFPSAQVFIDNLDEHDEWALAEESAVKYQGDMEFKFTTYKRV